MKVSTKGRYGLRALVDLTVSTIDAPVPLADIAGRQNISLNYLEQVFGQLRRAGIVRSIKGSGGGYRLAKDARQITVKEVLEALEGPFSIRQTLCKERYGVLSGMRSTGRSTAFWKNRLWMIWQKNMRSPGRTE